MNNLDLIVIPARFGSKRLPGKPLIKINGVELINRVINNAIKAKNILGDIEILVVTDHHLIYEHCINLGVNCAITDLNISSGTERALMGCLQIGVKPNYVLNLQGDAPFILPDQIVEILNFARSNNVKVATPVVNLKWEQLDILRDRKKITPFSGTTCVIDEKSGKALWFSKNIIPAIRNEDLLRKDFIFSPVYQHLGLYCYSFETLDWFVNTNAGLYEVLEELEQLRFIENGIQVDTVKVKTPKFSISGIDSPEDLIRAEELIELFGDPYLD